MLVEMMLAGLLISIVMSIAFLTADTLLKTTTASIRTGTAFEVAQGNLNRISTLLRGVISPYQSALAASVGIQANAPCWGTATPIGTLPSTSAGYPSPSTLGVVTANDFAIEFCGLRSGSTPHMYALFVATPNTTPAGTCVNNYCPLELADLGAGGAAPPPITAVPTSSSSVQIVMRNLYCDATCQNDTGTGSGTTAGLDMSPLFSYYSGPATTGTAMSTPMDVIGNPSTSKCPALSTSGCYYYNLSQVNDVFVQMTALGDSANAAAPNLSNGHGAVISGQVFLSNLAYQ
jgi:hypothetical protein